MRLQVAPCEDGDMDLAFAVISEAFGHEHPYFDYCFPKHDTHEGRKTGGERILAVKNGDPNTTYIKVTDSGTGLIIGVAKWNVYDGVQPEEADLDGPYWDSDSDKRLAQEMWAGYLLPRRQAIKDTGGKLVCNTVISGRNYNLADTGGKALDMMCVHPSYQRAGAGHLLLEWGVDIADEKGLKVSFSCILNETAC